MIPSFDAAAVDRLLTPRRARAAVRAAMRAHSAGEAVCPPRMFAPLAGGGGSLGVMPGSASGLPAYGAKLISLHPDNPVRGLPTIQGVVVLFDAQTGSPCALVDAARLTALRTAAASALAAEVLARPDSATHGVLGTGAQALTHAAAMADALPSIARTLVWGRDRMKTIATVEALAREGLDARLAETAREAVACDVVSAVTGASTPVVKGTWLRPGAHLNLVGSHTPDAREADSAAVQGARFYVDSREAALREAGDLLLPLAAGEIDERHIVAEIGEVLADGALGRRTPQEITLYKSLGIAVQDLYAAWAVVEAARGD